MIVNMDIESLQQLAQKYCRSKTIIAIDYSKLERLVQAAYDIPEWSFVADNEMNNDSEKEINIKAEELDKYDAGKLEEFITSKGRKGSYLTTTIMTDLCNKNILQPGCYIVSVCW